MAVHVFGTPNGAVTALPERFERKYYLAPWDVDVALVLLRQVCLPAPEYPSEQINSLYFDTPELEQHERSDGGDYCKDKVRIRWYGEEGRPAEPQSVFVELKSRRGFVSTKQRLRSSVPAEDLAGTRLSRGILPGTLLLQALAGLGYFPADMLLPVVKISYWRHRFSDLTTGQRVALDCRIRSTMVMPQPGNGERELELPGGIIEVKGRSMERPPALRSTRMLQTDWTRFSKYSACIDAHSEKPGAMGRLSPPGRVIQA